MRSLQTAQWIMLAGGLGILISLFLNGLQSGIGLVSINRERVAKNAIAVVLILVCIPCIIVRRDDIVYVSIECFIQLALVEVYWRNIVKQIAQSILCS